jgi:hypothetical protein
MLCQDLRGWVRAHQAGLHDVDPGLSCPCQVEIMTMAEQAARLQSSLRKAQSWFQRPSDDDHKEVRAVPYHASK